MYRKSLFIVTEQGSLSINIIIIISILKTKINNYI